MLLLSQLLTPRDLALAAVGVLSLSACVTVWIRLVLCWARSQRVVPYQPRRPVPWGGLDLLLVVAVYLMSQPVLAAIAGVVLSPDDIRPPAAFSAEESSTEHPVAKLLTKGDAWVVLLCFASAVIVAPLVEELLFRVLLQGCLEAVARRWRRQAPVLRRSIPRAAGPIVFTALLFAAMHFRVAGPPLSPRLAVFLLAGDSVAKLLIAVFAVCLVRWRAGATAADLGWAPQKLLGDIELGLTVFVAIAAPLYLLQFGLIYCLPKGFAPDPVPLFLFALVLGTLYYRTHRVVPSMVLHAALNAASVALAIWTK